MLVDSEHSDVNRVTSSQSVAVLVAVNRYGATLHEGRVILAVSALLVKSDLPGSILPERDARNSATLRGFG